MAGLNKLQLGVWGRKTVEYNFATNMMAYWKLATNSNDFSGNGHNGTDTGIVYSGGYAQFGAGKYIDVADSNDFSFTDGTNDLPAHFLISFAFDTLTQTQFWINKRLNSSQREWQINSDGATIYFRFLSPNNSPNEYISLTIPMNSLAVGLNTLQFYYDGSKLHTGLKAYLNGNNSVGTTSSSGAYTGQVNGTSQVRMGMECWGTNFHWKARAKQVAIWKNRTMTGDEIQKIHDRVIAGISLI